MFVSTTGGQQLYPKLIQLSCDFNVLHQDNIILDGVVTNANFPFGTSLTDGISSEADQPTIITSPTLVEFN